MSFRVKKIDLALDPGFNSADLRYISQRVAGDLSRARRWTAYLGVRHFFFLYSFSYIQLKDIKKRHNEYCLPGSSGGEMSNRDRKEEVKEEEKTKQKGRGKSL